MPVYTPNCFEPPSSLSHFEDMCYPTNAPTNNNMYFTMSNANGAGVNKRFLRPEERKVLCDIGYTVAATYTSLAQGASTVYSGGACSGPPIWGINDGIVGGAYTYTSSGATVSINISGATGIINNDATITTSAVCVETVYNNGTVGVNGNLITFTPAANFTGDFLLRYIPINVSGAQGNITYIFGYIFPSGCSPISACDMVQNRGFETNLNCGPIVGNPSITVACWNRFTLTPDLLVNNCTYSAACNLGVSTMSSTPTFSSHNMTTNANNRAVVGIAGYSQLGNGYAESLMNFMGAPLIPATSYNLSFWAYQYSGTKIDPALGVNITQPVNTPSLPVVLSFATSSIPIVPVGADFPVTSQETILTTTLANQMNTWKYYSYQFTYTPVITTTGNILYVGPNSALNLSMAIAAGQPSTGATLYYMLIDDISLKPASQTVSITLVSTTLCPGNGYTNLAQYVSVRTGTFTGPGVSTVIVNGNVQYNFNIPGLLNPGVYTLTYSYWDNLGCLQTTYVQITLQNQGATPQLALSTNSLCTGTNATITATSTYTNFLWLPGNYTTNAIVVPAGSGTTYTILTVQSPSCTTSNTVYIPLSDLVPNYVVASPSPGVCSGVATTFTLSGWPPIASFTCNPGNFTSSPFTYVPNGNTQFTLNVLTTQACSLTSTHIITVKTDCCTGTTNIVNSLATNSVTNLSGSNVVNFPIVVPASSTLNVIGELKFAAGVFLRVDGVVYLNGSHLYSCGTDMWEGIRLTRGSTFISQSGGTTNLIEDAKIAIDITEVPWNGDPVPSTNSGTFQPPICKIDNTIFNKNYIGIHIENFPITTTTNYNFILNSSVFTCRNLAFSSTTWSQSNIILGTLRYATPQAATVLSSPYLFNLSAPSNLKPPYANIKSFAAIQLNRVGTTTSNNTVYSLVIGETANIVNNFNLFDSHAIGIDALNSHVASYNNVFQNTQYNASAGINAGIRHINTYNLANPYGTNLWLQNAKLDLVAPNNPANCNNKFYDCNNGVYAAGTSSLNIKYALFSSSQTTATPVSQAMPGFFGINIMSNKFDNYQINTNKFLNLFAGINCHVKFDYLSFSPQNTVYGERWGTFSCTANYFSAASATNASVGNGRTALGINISAPVTSSVNQSFFALNPNNGLKVMYNNFDRVACGISMSNMQVKAYTKTLANNAILLATNNNTNLAQWGIKSTANNKGIVNTNTVIGFTTANLNIAGILHEDNFTGASVQCNNVSNLPRGFEHRNKNPNMMWRENKMTNCWHGMHATNWGTTAIGGIGQQGSSGNKSGNQWLGTAWSASSLQTWVDNNTNAGNSKLWVMSSGNESLLTNNQGFLFPNSPQNSYQDPNNRPPTNTGMSYCPTQAGGCAGCTARGGNDEYDLDSEIANLLLFISIDLDSLNALNNDTLDAWYADLEDQIGDLFKIEGFLSQGDFATAQSYINSYSPETNLQENFKSYFQLYRKYAQYDSLSSYDSLSLLVLANQCPAVDGPAVHKARTLFDLINGTLTFYNDDSCETSGYTGARNGTLLEQSIELSLLKAHESEQIKGRTRNHYSIFPNPASTHIAIQSSEYRGLATILIFDVSGHLLLQEHVSLETTQIKLPVDLMNGVYYLKILDTKNGCTVKKVVISK
jgi:hypothetical protein